MTRQREGLGAPTPQPKPKPEQKLTRSQYIKEMQTSLDRLTGDDIVKRERQRERARIVKATLEQKMHDDLMYWQGRDTDRFNALIAEVKRLQAIDPSFDPLHPGTLPEPTYTDYSDWEGEEEGMWDVS